MKLRKILSICLFLTITLSMVRTLQGNAHNQDFVPGMVLVGLYEPYLGSSPEALFPELEIEEISDLFGRVDDLFIDIPCEYESTIECLRGTVFVITLVDKTNEAVLNAIEILERNPNVEYAEPNGIIPRPQLYFTPQNLDTADTWAHEGIIEAYNKGFMTEELQNNYTNSIGLETAYTQTLIRIYFEGEQIQSDVSPEIVNDRTMVPLRVISEAFGAEVDWDSESQSVMVKTEDQRSLLKIDERRANFITDNCASVIRLESAPYIRNGRAMVPLRFLAENLGLIVNWNDRDRAVIITLPELSANRSVSSAPYIDIPLVTPLPYSVPFISNRQSNFGMSEPPTLYEYLDGAYLYCDRTPYSQDIELGDEYIHVNLSWWEPHTAVTHWVRDIEVKDNVMIINTIRLDDIFGGRAMTFIEINTTVDRIYAPNVTEYEVVTRNVQRAPSSLTVTIRESLMDSVVNKDFVPEDFGPLVSDICYQHQDFGLGRRLVVHARHHEVDTQLEALSFVTQVHRGFGLGSEVGLGMVLSIDPAYNDKFDKEQFALSDFSSIPEIVAIIEYDHPSTRVSAQINLILYTPGTQNLNLLKDYVNNHVWAVETIDWVDRYRIIYHYRH